MKRVHLELKDPLNIFSNHKSENILPKVWL